MKQKYKIIIQDRTYSTYNYVDIDTNTNVTLPIVVDPVKHKLFSKDIFTLDIDTSCETLDNIELFYSHIRSGIALAGVLILDKNRTYGRSDNKKRLLYKCIPDDKHLPVFLIPYEVKLGFNKSISNKYVVFKFDSWSNEHPYGILTEVLGDINNLEVFYEYQLHCKSLHQSLVDMNAKANLFLKHDVKCNGSNHGKIDKSIQKKVRCENLDKILLNPDFNIQDHTHKYVFTIDPKGSNDFDDGFCIEQPPDSCNTIITIYIANVYFWMETMGLWNSFSSRVATIYLPDRRRPMLPTILSDTLCSLQQEEIRFAFAMELTFNNDNREIISINYKNAAIKVAKNFRYEEPDLIYKNKHYTKLIDFSQKLDKTIENSHDLVTFWMIFMNKNCGDYMFKNKIGIFRSAGFNHPLIDIDEQNCKTNNLPKDTQRIIKTWGHVTGQYIVYNETVDMEHELLNIKSYTHMTSPIRRLVDLLNQMWISKHLGIITNCSKDSDDFFKKWLSQMEYLNISMRSIRKIQVDCEVLHRCYKEPEITQTIHQGLIFDKVTKNDGSIMYMVYLESLKILTRFISHNDYPDYTYHSFKIFIFEDEDKVKRKIRVHLVTV